MPNRPATAADLTAIAAIYRHHVLTGTASFEIDPPSDEEITRRWQTLLAGGYPYIVAEQGSEILGYAYASANRPRAAYRDTVEDSIYLAPEAIGHGTGTRLLQALIDLCTAQGFRQMIAVVGDSANTRSVRLHTSHGFRLVGTFRSVGFKHGRWLDTVLLQRPLGPGDTTLPDRP